MSNSFVGIDIGNTNCKIAIRDGSGARLVSAVMPENMVSSGTVVAPSTMATFLRTVRTDNHIRARNCFLVLAESQSFFRHVSLPKMTIDELKINLPYEFRDFIEGNPSDYVYDYAIDDGFSTTNEASDGLELYAAAAKKSLVQGHSLMLRHAGFRLKGVIPAQMAYSGLLRHYLQDHPEQNGKNVVLVNIGYANVTITLFSGYRFQASKVIELGCRDIDEAIADDKNVDRYTASTFKNSNYEGVLDLPICKDIYDRLCVEINKVLNFYNFSNQGSDVEKAFLLGGGAQIPQLVSTIKKFFSRLPVEDIGATLLPEEFRDASQSSLCALAVAALIEGEAM